MNPISATDTIKKLFARINYERQSKIAPGDFKLSNMLKLMERLGNIHLNCPVIHIAGTKGKGSASAFVGAILTAAGLKTGVYSSPHLERVNQRIAVDGIEISDTDLRAVLDHIDPHINEMDLQSEKSATKKLTFFEVITASAFQYFATSKVDAVVLEVGMGGRLDSTNICSPVLSVITNISLDHTKQLGSTVEEIAAEKAGIIKHKVPVVSGVQKHGPQAVISKVATNNRAELFQINDDFKFINPNAGDSFNFEMNLDGIHFAIDKLVAGMPGKHQQLNASIATAACHILRSRNGWPIENQHIRTGIANAKLPGRCEIVNHSPLVVMDIAHNEASTSALADTLISGYPKFVKSKRKYLIFAASKEKNVEAMLQPLVSIFDEIIFTRYLDNPRSRLASELFELGSNLVANRLEKPNLLIRDEPTKAWEYVQNHVQDSDTVCVTGSVFLVAELRPIFIKNDN